MTLIGATTENPYFEVNNALLSRAQIYELRSLTAEQVEGLMRTRARGRASAATARSPTTCCRSWPRARAATRARR